MSCGYAWFCNFRLLHPGWDGQPTAFPDLAYEQSDFRTVPFPKGAVERSEHNNSEKQ